MMIHIILAALAVATSYAVYSLIMVINDRNYPAKLFSGSVCIISVIILIGVVVFGWGRL